MDTDSRAVSGESTGKHLLSVIGLGYVGLPTALAYTDLGYEVVGIDIDETRLAAIKDGRVDLMPRDRVRLQAALDRQLLTLTTEPAAVATAEAVVVCVPTPVDAHLAPDLRPLQQACESLVENVKPGQVLVLTSTTYPGCTRDMLVKPLQSRGYTIGRDVFVAFSPERINPGVADHSPETTPRVLGGVTEECTRHAQEFLAPTAASLHTVSSPEAAEMSKLLENTFRAVNIALANEFADAAREVGVDVMEVIEAASTKPYGFMPFYPGAGVGGHCIPCDPHYLLWQLRAKRTHSPVTDAAMTAIAERPRQVVESARRILGDHSKPVRGARVLITGVSYKPGVGDVRESPALPIIDMLADAGADVAFTDRYVESVRTAAGNLSGVDEPEQQQWDLVIVHTVHPDDDLDWLAAQPAVLDTTYRLSALPRRYVP